MQTPDANEPLGKPLDTAPDTPLDETERQELLRLRQEAAARSAAGGSAPGAPSRSSRHSALRWTATALLLVLTAILAVSAVLARYTRSELLDTDRYVQTVTPLGSDPTVQTALTDQVTDAIVSQLDIQSATADALQAIVDNAPRVPPAVVGLAPVIADQAQSFIHRTVASLLSSDEFEALWVQANRQAHESLVSVLTGDTRTSVQIDDAGTVSISLAPIIDKARARLTDRGFAFADKIPTIDKSFVLFQSPQLVKAQNATSALDKASTVLPWLTVLVAAGAVWAAPKHSRLRAFALVGVSVVVAMALLAVALSIGRSVYLGAVDPERLSPQVAETLFDAVAAPLRTTLRAVLALAVLITVVAYLSGSSGSARALRRAYGRAMNAARKPGAGRAPHPVEIAALRFRLPLRVLIVAAAVITLVFWKYPSGVVVVVTILIAVAALIVLELVARPALPDPAIATISGSPTHTTPEERSVP